MRTNNTAPIPTAPMFVDEWKDGITPTVQARLEQAAEAVRLAIEATEKALDAAEERSDACSRCDESLTHLEEALTLLQWTPAAEH